MGLAAKLVNALLAHSDTIAAHERKLKDLTAQFARSPQLNTWGGAGSMSSALMNRTTLLFAKLTRGPGLMVQGRRMAVDTPGSLYLDDENTDEIDVYAGHHMVFNGCIALLALGVAALMWSKNGCGSLSAPQVRNTIFGTALSYSWSYPYCYVWEPDHVSAIGAVNAIPLGTTAGTGDLDCDGMVSGDDFHRLAPCMTGVDGGPVTSFCVAGDYPESPPDGDVDLRDFAQFQQDFTGYGEGACCHINATCTEGPVTDCREEFFAFYQGHGTTCATTECPIHPWGACCDVYTGECSIMEEDDCVWSNGVYQGDGTDCETTTCPVVRYDNTIDPLTTYIGSPTGILADDVTLDGSGGGYVRQYTVGLYAGYAGSFDATVSLHTGYPPESGNLISGTEFTYYNLPDNGSPVFVSPIVEPTVYIPHSVWLKVNLHGSTAAGWFRAEEPELGFTENYYAQYDPPWKGYWWGEPPTYPWAGFWATITCDATRGGQSDDDDSQPMIWEPSEILTAPPGQRLSAPIGMNRQSTIVNRQSNGPTDERRPLPHGHGSDQSDGTPPGGAGPRSGTVTLELTSPAAGQAVQAGELVAWSITATVSDSDNSGLALVCVDLLQDAGNPELFDIPIATTVGVGMEGFQRPANSTLHKSAARKTHLVWRAKKWALTSSSTKVSATSHK